MPRDPDILVPLIGALTEFEASVMVEALKAEGIPAHTFATAATTLQWDIASTQPIKVMVRRADIERAATVLKSIRTDSVDLDWDEVVGAGAEPEENAQPAPAERPTYRPMVVVCAALLAFGSTLLVVGATWAGVVALGTGATFGIATYLIMRSRR